MLVRYAYFLRSFLHTEKNVYLERRDSETSINIPEYRKAPDSKPPELNNQNSIKKKSNKNSTHELLSIYPHRFQFHRVTTPRNFSER